MTQNRKPSPRVMGLPEKRIESLSELKRVVQLRLDQADKDSRVNPKKTKIIFTF